MLSISTKRGESAKDVQEVAKYPDESKDKAKAPGAIEDYYSQGNDKTPSVWMGSAAEALGLSGSVDREDHIKTLQGLDPNSGQGLVQGSGEDRKYAVDLTFSAPKSVSIVWAIGGGKNRAGIETAQTRAVAKVLEHIEANFPMARQGSSSKGTIEYVKAKLLAAAFLHGSSRPTDDKSIPDPQVHTHLMLQNMALREDGTWGALDTKQLYEWKMALGAIYRAELAREVETLGFKVEADGDFFRIKGIPRELEEEFSGRRAEIKKKLEEKGLTGGKAAEIAALDTRAAKEVLDTSILQADWDARAAENNVTKESVEALKGLEKEIAPGAISLSPEDRAEILEKLTKMEAVFQEKDLFKEAAIALSHRGQGLEDVKKEVAVLKRHPDLIKLRGLDGKAYYTTKEMLELEKGILSRALAGKDDRSHVLDPEIVRKAIERREREQGFTFSDEQKSGIAHMTQEAGQTKIVQGHAGAGKSTALVPVRYAYEDAGYEVIGCALQGKTAKLMESDTGIKSQTIASLLRELEGYAREDGTRADPTRKLSSKSLIVVDEAMMCDTRTLHRLQVLATEAGAKLELAGDTAQVAPVAAGAPVRSMMKALGGPGKGYAELTENRRQESDWMKEASLKIRMGNVKEAFAQYAQEGMIIVVKDRDEAIKVAVEEWGKTYDPDKPNDVPLTAFRNADVAELNRTAREVAQSRGYLRGPECIATTFNGDLIVQEGDRLMFRKKDTKIGVVNGEVGTIEKIDLTNGDMHVKVDGKDGKTVIVPATYDHLEYGYALTINKSQGLSEREAVGLVSLQNLEQTYVQGTRHKKGLQMIMAEDQVDRAFDELGDRPTLSPTEKMLSYADKLSEKYNLELPAGIDQDFDMCRNWLNKYSPKKMDERTQETDEKALDFGLEKVQSLIGCLSQSREKMNALDFAIEEPEKELERETLEKTEDREPKGAEKSQERERYRDRERDGLSFGL